MVAGDAGKTIKIGVSFTDDESNDETLVSAATTPVVHPPFTASIEGDPAAHDGATAFTFELRLSEEPRDGFSYKTLRDHAFTVTGGEVTGVSRLAPPSNARWEIRVEPSGNAEVTVSLPVTTDCASQGAICTGDGRKLSTALEFTVPGPGDQQESNNQQQPSPLTASARSAPASHDGSDAFTFELRFSEEFPISYKTLRDHAFTVTGGAVTGARRLEPPSSVGWEISVSPTSDAAVTIMLPVTTDCAADGAVCTQDGRPLSSRLELTVSGPGG